MSLTVPPGRTHMYYTGEPEFAFGDGLSYSTFEMASAGAATEAGATFRVLVLSSGTVRALKLAAASRERLTEANARATRWSS